MSLHNFRKLKIKLQQRIFLEYLFAKLNVGYKDIKMNSLYCFRDIKQTGKFW